MVFRLPHLSANELYIGLMSGTSMDALDGVLVDFSSAQANLLASRSITIPKTLRGEFSSLCQPGDNELARMASADIALAKLSAELVRELLQATRLPSSSIQAIGSHGQTIRHAPNASPPFTWQIGDGNTLAELSGITTVADFRRRDIAAGGQGAPLVPAFHAWLYQSPDTSRVVLNIGGMANITILPSEVSHAIGGFDTGPGNILLDTWIQTQQGLAMDENGAWGAQGEPIPTLLEQWLADPYFHLPPPKSTGREHFNLEWLESSLQGKDYAAVDVQASLYELSARSIAEAIQNQAPESEEIVVCGGGAYNPLLLSRLRAALGQRRLLSSQELEPGIEPRWMEAMAFAWLARQTLSGKSGNLPAVTGATHGVVLGGIYLGRNELAQRR
jgi:anhydro-N-acetylmuramic acid kinase